VLAIDPNVIVRLLVRHDDEQLRRAKSLLASSEVFVANTVMLECEWVLPKRAIFYHNRFSPARTAPALTIDLERTASAPTLDRSFHFA
jgi:hypothetical protein